MPAVGCSFTMEPYIIICLPTSTWFWNTLNNCRACFVILLTFGLNDTLFRWGANSQGKLINVLQRYSCLKLKLFLLWERNTRRLQLLAGLEIQHCGYLCPNMFIATEMIWRESTTAWNFLFRKEHPTLQLKQNTLPPYISFYTILKQPVFIAKSKVDLPYFGKKCKWRGITADHVVYLNIYLSPCFVN